MLSVLLKNQISSHAGSYDFVSQRYAHAGSRKRQYSVYVPKGYAPQRAAPLVMVLHGCHQTHRDIAAITGFNRLADKYGFLVAYPFVTLYTDFRGRNCWGWWMAEQTRPGAGEVEDLRCIVEEIAGQFRVDAKRVHIAGLSSGAGMTVAALTVHSDLFASGAVCAGVTYAEKARAVSLGERRDAVFVPVAHSVAMMRKVRSQPHAPVPLLIAHSHDDRTVDIQAGRNLRDAWLEYFGLHDLPPQCVEYRITAGVPWMRTRYGRQLRRSVVETIFLEGPGHGWYGGEPGDFSYPAGPDVSRLMWQFFAKRKLNPPRCSQL